MNHAEVRELLELAAVESGGLDRIAAGDTVEAAAVAGHLAGCPACLEELERLRRSSGIIRDFVVEETVEEEPPIALPPELREKTLALIRDLGVARPITGRAAPVAPPSAIPLAPRSAEPVAQPVAATSAAAATSTSPRRLRIGRRTAWIASIAAAIVLSVVATSALTGAGASDKNGLADVVRWSSDMAAAPGARHIVLTSAGTGQADGDLSIVPSTGALIVVVPDLGAPPSGREYRCWLETATGRTWVGKMFIDEGISYWVGTVPSLAAAPAGTTFGVSLEDAAGSKIDGPVVLHGTL